MRHTTFVLLALSLPFSLAARVCDPEPDRVCPSQPVAKYCYTAKDATCTSGKVGVDVPWNFAPIASDTQVLCDYMGFNRYSCEAWPQDGGLGYAWATSGSLALAGAPFLDSDAEVTCSPGPNNILYLTVTSPYGLSTTVQSTPLYCGFSGEY
jgi:hypothetical protein